MKKRQGDCIKFIFLAVVFLLLGLAIHFGYRKEGYYIDELWSYGLANSYETPFLQEKEGYMEEWHRPDFYKEYLTVGTGHAFAWESVYSNQVQDVHPPLYFFLLHGISSFFPEQFSKWYGLSINLLFYAVTLLLLYELGGIWDNGGESIVRLVVPVLYGVSAGALSNAVYIRMYTMLTCVAVLFAVLVRRAMIKEGTEHRKNLTALMAVSAIGTLTQYYFLIFAFFLSACYVLWRLFRKEWRKALAYTVSVCAGIGIGILIFPALLQHILVGEKGQESFINIIGNLPVFTERLTRYVKILSEAFWGGHTRWFLVSLLASLVCAVVLAVIRRWKNVCSEGTAQIYICFLALSVCGYFLLVVQISTDIVNRYQFLIYPFICLLLVYPIVEVCRFFRKEYPIWILAAGYVFYCFYAYGKGDGTVTSLYTGYGDTLQAMETKYQDAPGIYVTKGDHLVIGNCLFLSRQKWTYALPIEELPALHEKLEQPEVKLSCKPEDGIILYVDIYYPEQSTAEEVCRLLGYGKVEHLYDNQFTQIYVLVK